MIETQLAQIAVAVPAVDSGNLSQGNPRLPLKMLAWWPPDGVTHPGGHPTLTMLEDLHAKEQTHGEDRHQ
jgi:hypothetical protein